MVNQNTAIHSIKKKSTNIKKIQPQVRIGFFFVTGNFLKLSRNVIIYKWNYDDSIIQHRN